MFNEKITVGMSKSRILQFFPMTKKSKITYNSMQRLTLADREWDCPDFNTKHDRDINAAININKFALDKQNLIGI